MKTPKDPKIDQYIKGRPPFARPVLAHLRKVVREACPQTVETMKWDSPFFLYNGKVLCGMGAFKAHCKFFLWNWRTISSDLGEKDKAEMAKLRQIARISDLPSPAVLKRFLKRAMQLREPGAKPVARAPRRKKPPVKTPPELLRALRGTPKALTVYEGFSPSHKRHYVDWITAAKTEGTREKRLEKAVECLAAGKKRHWD